MSKVEPKSWKAGYGNSALDLEGRVITFRFNHITIVTAYFFFILFY
jgi:exonuclease III